MPVNVLSSPRLLPNFAPIPPLTSLCGKAWKLLPLKNMKSSTLQYLLPRQVPFHSNFVIRAHKVSQHLVGFIDPCADASNPGWPLRNLLAYLRALYPKTTSSLRILRWKDAESSESSWKCQIGTIKIPDVGESVDPTVKPAAVGWEKNPQGKLGPRVADLAPMMDPTRFVAFKVDNC